jgi:hypothetical protein
VARVRFRLPPPACRLSRRRGHKRPNATPSTKQRDADALQQGDTVRRIQRNQSVLWRAIDGEAVLLDPDQGVTVTLNRVGTRIWQLAEGREVSEIAAILCAEFDAEPTVIEADLHAFIDQLVAARPVETCG